MGLSGCEWGGNVPLSHGCTFFEVSVYRGLDLLVVVFGLIWGGFVVILVEVSMVGDGFRCRARRESKFLGYWVTAFRDLTGV